LTEANRDTEARETAEATSPTEAAPLPDDVEGLKQLVEQERARAEDYRAQWQRARADFANLKRRSEQEKAEATQFANAMLILNLLPILDDLERALASVSTKLAGLTWVDGIRLIYRKFQTTLQAHGLTEIAAVGENFDPNLHEAILYVEGEEGKVVEEVQKGYKLYDRVIRPALVKVGGKTPETQASQAPKED